MNLEFGLTLGTVNLTGAVQFRFNPDVIIIMFRIFLTRLLLSKDSFTRGQRDTLTVKHFNQAITRIKSKQGLAFTFRATKRNLTFTIDGDDFTPNFRTDFQRVGSFVQRHTFDFNFEV